MRFTGSFGPKMTARGDYGKGLTPLGVCANLGWETSSINWEKPTFL